MSSTIESAAKPPSRLCHVMKWDHFDGYGFNLHAEKGKPGQYIGKVDDGSPAEAAGLRQGDKILEVNGVPIGDKTHKQVVELIKSRRGDTAMLVVDPAPSANGNTVAAAEEQTNSNNKNGTNTSTNGTIIAAVPLVEEKKKATHLEENGAPAAAAPGMLNLNNMTAAELRAKLASKKKYDPKKEMMDFKKKFDIVQKL